jgi:hypothetical protein
MTCHAYLFETVSIQSYILDSGKLKELVGASELLEALTGEVLDNVLQELNLQECGDIGKTGEEGVVFSRRAGGAIFAFATSPTPLEQLQALWTLTVRQIAPGLGFMQGWGAGQTEGDAYNQARQEMDGNRNTPVWDPPQPGPLAAYNPRNGKPASQFLKRENRPIDPATAMRRRKQFREGRSLLQKFGGDPDSKAWPTVLDPHGEDVDPKKDSVFPLPEDNRYLAVIHADGNGLGQLIMAASDALNASPEDYVTGFRELSRAVSRAGEDAAWEAAGKWLEKDPDWDTFPARPIVLGGDDLTILVRADRALDFTREWVRQFAEKSKKELKPLRHKPWGRELPVNLTACAGVAFVRASQPFSMAYELAEELCQHAKEHAKAWKQEEAKVVPAALAFHRATTSLIDDYSAILSNELQAPHTGDRLTWEVYGLGDNQAEGLPSGVLPDLANLEALAALLIEEEGSKGGLREILGMAGRSPAEARRGYERWRRVREKHHPRWLREFDNRIERITGGEAEELFVQRQGGVRATPLGDALNLAAVMPEKAAKAEEESS